MLTIKTFPVNMIEENTYVVSDESGDAVIIDCGALFPDELEAMFMKIPGVKNVAVFEHKLDDKTVAYAVFSVEEGVTLEKLAVAVANANKKLASYKWVFSSKRRSLGETIYTS